MKKLIAVVLLSTVASGADRTTVDLETGIDPYHMELNTLPDGGCAVQVHVRLTQSDGGTKTESSGDFVEVAGANRTTCLDIVKVKGLALYKLKAGF